MITIDATWQPPPAVLALDAGEIHLWRVSLDLPPAFLDTIATVLSQDERLRTKRFRFEQDQTRFQAGRSILRSLLSGYLGQRPEEVKIGYSEWGKPFLEGQAGPNGVHFNVSHSGNLVLFAVARGQAVGVDIEWIRRDIEVASLAEFTFSRRETAELSALHPSQQFDAFYSFWSRKEAYVKALGSGLLCPLKEFAVSLLGDEVLLCTDEGDTLGLSPWRVLPLCCEPGYASALAVNGQDWRIKQFTLSPVTENSFLSILPFRSTGEEEKGLIPWQFL